MAKQPSRASRWAEACALMREAADEASTARDKYIEGMAALKEVQDEYNDWKDNLPENLQSSALGEKLEAVCGIDLESEPEEMDTSALDDAENTDLPLGFGRD